MVSAFEGNRAETKTMLPVIRKFMAARSLPDVTVVADAGMISEANQKATGGAVKSVNRDLEAKARDLAGLRTGWSIRKFVKTARRYRTIEIQAGRQTITAADPLSDELSQALDAITRGSGSQSAH
jgi:transposase